MNNLSKLFAVIDLVCLLGFSAGLILGLMNIINLYWCFISLGILIIITIVIVTMCSLIVGKDYE